MSVRESPLSPDDLPGKHPQAGCASPGGEAGARAGGGQLVAARAGAEGRAGLAAAGTTPVSAVRRVSRLGPAWAPAVWRRFRPGEGRAMAKAAAGLRGRVGEGFRVRSQVRAHGVRRWTRKEVLQATGVGVAAAWPVAAPQGVAVAAAPRPLVGMEYETWYACPSPLGAPTAGNLAQEAAAQAQAIRVAGGQDLNSAHLALDLAQAEARFGCNPWASREATPLLGTYWSSAARVIGQHALWLAGAGVDFVLVDWSNNLGGNWDNGVALSIMGATWNLLEGYRRLPRHPAVVLMLGLDDGQAGTPRFQRQVDLVHRAFVASPRFQGLFQGFLGRPLLPVYTGPTGEPPPDWTDPRFTVRWVNAFEEVTHANAYGAWSWIDRQPQVVYRSVLQGGTMGRVAEAVTVAAGYPGSGAPASWLAPDAGPRRHGATYLAQWSVAFAARPEVVLLCQWNEFRTPDQYDAEHSNDMEPTALHGWGVNGSGGWGYYYLGLTRTLTTAFKAGRPLPAVRLNPEVP